MSIVIMNKVHTADQTKNQPYVTLTTTVFTIGKRFNSFLHLLNAVYYDLSKLYAWIDTKFAEITATSNLHTCTNVHLNVMTTMGTKQLK